MIKKILFLISMCCMILSYLKAQDDEIYKKTFLDNINKIRKEYSIQEIKFDTMLSNAASKLYINYLLKGIKDEEINKDTIRSILRSQGNFDYNIETFYIELSSLEELNFKKQLKKNIKLNKVLLDSLYNNIGYFINKNENKYQVQLIATQNYIRFCNEFALIIKEYVDRTSEYSFICGYTNENDIYFKPLQYLNNNSDQIICEVEQKIKKDQNNYFEIAINISENLTSPPNWIKFYNQAGKTISCIKLKITLHNNNLIKAKNYEL